MKSLKMKKREILLIDLTCVLLDFFYFNLMFLKENSGFEIELFVRAILIFSLTDYERP